MEVWERRGKERRIGGGSEGIDEDRGTGCRRGEMPRSTRAGCCIYLRAVLIEVNEVGTIVLRVGRRVGRLIGCEVH